MCDNVSMSQEACLQMLFWNSLAVMVPLRPGPFGTASIGVRCAILKPLNPSLQNPGP